MICRLCLKDISEVIQIFDVVGLELNVAMVLSKYFWFEPKNDDPISTVVCNSCWIKVSNFHEFYMSVEQAHRLLSERFIIKAGEKLPKREWPNMDNTTIFVTESKSESAAEDDVQKDCPQSAHSETKKDDEVDEPIGVFLEEDKVNAGEDVDESDTKVEDDSESNKEGENENAIEKNKELSNNGTFEDNPASQGDTEDKKLLEDEILLDEQLLVKKIFDGPQCLQEDGISVYDKFLIKEEPLEANELRRSSRRNITKSNAATITSLRQHRRPDFANRFTENPLEVPNPKRKGRPRKLSVVLQNENTPLSPGQCDRKELKSQASDEKISSFMRLLCHVCGEELSTFYNLRHHVTQKHGETTVAYVMCCNKKFYKRILLIQHIDRHLNPECYKCAECNKVFADKQCLRNHMLLKHQPDELKIFECEQCPKKFAKPYLLEQHMIVHAARDHICEVCQKGFPGASQLAAHMKAAHSTSYGTMCHICARLIRGRAAFERHQLEHTGVKIPKVQCEKCGSWHKDKYSLQKHRRRHNDEGTLHICHICNKVSPNRSALLSHFRYVHAAERTYECSICKKAFKKPLNLKEHMAMHTGEVLYSCPHCEKTFNSNANMHSHRKKIHPLEFEEQRRLRRNMSAEEANTQLTHLSAEDATGLLSTEEYESTDADITIYTEG